MTSNQTMLIDTRQSSAPVIATEPLARRSRLVASFVVALLGSATFSEAASARNFFWEFDSYSEPASPPPLAQAPRKRVVTPKETYPKLPTASKTAPKPVGTLLVTISLRDQQMKVYDKNGLFSQTAISSGRSTHATPTGVFSVIQKSKWHRSNLYSDAPMPFMQRLTWSGIAIHAGALPGYPASHGCIRVPMKFASEIWTWTRMGARVVVTDEAVTPEPITHALLPVRAPSADDTPMAQTPDRQKQSSSRIAPAADTEITLRPALSDDDAKARSSAELVRLADARPAASRAQSNIVSDATGSIGAAEETGKEAAQADAVQAETTDKPAAINIASTPPETAPAEATDTPSQSTVVPEPEPEPVVKGRIAMFVSNADKRLYVRRNFEPMFDVEISISDDVRPIGTHLYTMNTSADDKSMFSWNVVTLPPEAVRLRSAKTSARSAKTADISEATPSTALEALDRLTIPADAMRRITESMQAGSSLLISDRSLKSSKETGRGTEFILSSH